MNCESIQQLLSAYVDGELTQKEQQQCEQHLETCEECQQTLQLFVEIKENMDVLEQVDLPAHFHSEIMKKIEQEPLHYKNKRSIYRWIGSIASIAAIGIGGMFLVQPKQMQAPMSGSFIEAMPQSTRNIPGEIMEDGVRFSEEYREEELITNLVIQSSNQEEIMTQIELWAQTNLIMTLRVDLEGSNGMELVGVQDYEAFELFLSQIQEDVDIAEENEYFGNVLTIKFTE